MPRDFRLIYFQNLNEKADANLVVSDQINQTQTRVVRERLEQKCDAVFLFCHLDIYRFGGLKITIFRVFKFL